MQSPNVTLKSCPHVKLDWMKQGVKCFTHTCLLLSILVIPSLLIADPSSGARTNEPIRPLVAPSGLDLKKIILGNDIAAGQQLAYVFPKNHWIGAKPMEGFEFSFVSCVTCPGFTFADWEGGDRQKLSDEYPHLKKTITMLTHELS